MNHLLVHIDQEIKRGARWLSARVLDSRVNPAACFLSERIPSECQLFWTQIGPDVFAKSSQSTYEENRLEIRMVKN